MSSEPVNSKTEKITVLLRFFFLLYVTARRDRSPNTLTEVDEPPEMGVSLGTGTHRHRSILPLMDEIRPLAVSASTNTVQPVLVFNC